MAEVRIKMTPKQSIKLKRFKLKTGLNIKKALSQIGRVLVKQAKRNVSGDGFSKNPARSSKYPGVKSGTMITSLIHKVNSKGDAVDVGTFGIEYAHRVVPVKFGGSYKGKKITGNFLTDTLDQKRKEMIDIFAGKLWKPLKGV